MAGTRQTIDIFAYERVREFLQAWRAADKVRSYKWLSHERRLDCVTAQVHGMFNTNPKSTTQRITRYTEAFVRVLQLAPDEAHYFRLLVRAEEAESPDREFAEQEAGRMRRMRGVAALPPSHLRFLEWYYFAIHNLVQLPGFRNDPEWIAATLRPQLSPEEVTRAVAHLREVGALEDDGAGGIRARTNWISFRPDEDPVAYRETMGNWHRWFVEQAPRALAGFAATERDFRATVVNVPQRRYAEVVKLLDECQLRILDLCESNGEEADRVFVVSSQLFPLTASVRSPEDSR